MGNGYLDAVFGIFLVRVPRQESVDAVRDQHALRMPSLDHRHGFSDLRHDQSSPDTRNGGDVS
eukprot:1933286-Rhodomonas_salina.3